MGRWCYQCTVREHIKRRNADELDRTDRMTAIKRYPHSNYLNKPPQASPELEHKLRTASMQIQKIFKTRQFTSARSNLTQQEKTTIKQLRDKDLIYLPSDKGGEFCIIEKDRYDSAALEHLNDATTYRPSRITKPQTIEKKINNIWRTITATTRIPDHIVRSYITNNSTMPRFYHLIKTHKEGPEIKIRPIVSGSGGPAAKLSYLTCKILNPLLKDVPAHLASSIELLDQIKALPKETLKTYSYPFSLDVTALYTSVPPKEAIDNAVTRLKDAESLCKPFHPEDIASLMEVILSNNVFQYQSLFYTQVSGLPMGNAMSGILAILFMDTLEKQTLRNLTNLTLYKRYVDDTLIITTSKREAEAIYNALNSAHPAINFEMELPAVDNSISLLDFTIRINRDGSIQHDFYQKKAKARLLPHFNSAIPTSVKRNIINNETKRRQERCSEPSNANMHMKEFKETMKMNGYPDNFQRPRRRQNRNQANNTRQAQDYMYFEFPYINDKIDKQIQKIFKETDLQVRLYRRSYTLRNALRPQRKTEACTIKDCPLKNNLCHSKNCVYQITCTKCHELYIGSTIRPFHTRLKEHLTSPVSSVFTHHQTCKADFTYKIIAKDNDAVRLRFKEAMLIHKHAAGINSRAEREELQSLIF